MSTAFKFKLLQRVSPSLRAQSSAMKLVEKPIFLEKPATQFPWSSLRMPPPPALPGFPRAEPSVLSQIQPCWGFSHLTCTMVLLPMHVGSRMQYWNSKALKTISQWMSKWAARSQKITLFLCFYIPQIAKGKIIFQWGLMPQLVGLIFAIFLHPKLKIILVRITTGIYAQSMADVLRERAVSESM